MEVILVRHSVTQGNKEKRFVGRLDVPLAPEGETLARETAPLLPTVEHLYISPMLRCRRTAELLWPGVEHTVVDDLRETDFGPFEGKNHEELKDDPFYQSWLNAPDFSAVPVGESPEACAVRLAEGLRRVVDDAAERGCERAGVVTHGGSLMGLMSQFGRPEREYYGWMRPNCGGFRVKVEREPLALTLLEEYGGDKA